MSKIGKILGIIVLLVVVIVVGLSLLVHFVLTEQKLKAILVPPAEKALGRQVTIGSINAGLFSGIVIHDFAVKEADGKTNFISTRAFVLRYDLLPLLQKRLAISELSLDHPAIHIYRKADGSFNYQSLAVFSKKQAREKRQAGPQTSTSAAALPLALSIDRVKINHATFTLEDESKKLPDVNATADLALRLNISPDFKSLSYDGTLDLDGTAAYGAAKPHLTGRVSFDTEKAKLDMKIVTAGQTINADGTIAGYRSTPKIKLDLTSKDLNLDKLLAMAAALPTGTSPSPSGKRVAAAGKPVPIAASFPKGLEASGKITVAKAQFKGVTVNAFLLRYQLANGILKIPEMGAVALGGSLASSSQIDLTRPQLSYKGNVDLSSVQADQLASLFAQKAAEVINGSLQSSIKFNGSGTSWDRIRQTLSGEGDFSIKNGQIRETPITSTISALLGTDRLENIAFKDLAGHFRIVKGGKVELQSSLNSADVKAKTTGRVGLDGSLDLPLTITLSPAISSSLGNRAGLGQLLKDSEGNTVLHLKLAGTLSRPRPTIGRKELRQQIGTAIEKKLFETLSKPSPSGENKGGTQNGGTQKNPQNTVNKLLKGIFSK